MDVANAESAQGPVSRRDIDVYLRTGTFSPETLVYKQGMASWTRISDIPELNEQILGKVRH